MLLVIVCVFAGINLVSVWPHRSLIPTALFSFFLSIPVKELAPFAMIVQALVVLVAGALAPQGVSVGDTAAFGVLVMSWGLVLEQWNAGRSVLAPFWFPFPRLPKTVTQRYGVRIGEHRRAVVDVYTPTAPASAPRPVVVYVHGGGWVVGQRRFQGRPLLHQLAKRGIVAVSVEYRLSPWATFPDHVIDVKRAIAWVRANAAELGVDPTRLAIAGNSAGAHLAALAALTPWRRDWQPGFEDADTSVRLASCFYGVYELRESASRWPHRGLGLLWRLLILKRSERADAQAWADASPMSHIGEARRRGVLPRFILLHGTADSMVPLQESRSFARALGGETTLIEVKGAQHAFELMHSPRADAAVIAVTEWFVARL